MKAVLSYIILGLRIVGIVCFVLFIIGTAKQSRNEFYVYGLFGTVICFGLAFFLWLFQFFLKEEDEDR